MGKYMRRKCGGADGDGKAAQATVVLGGVRTRSRSAAAAVVVAGSTPAKKRKQEATSAAVRLEEDASSGPEGGAVAGCYLHLRSRSLFRPAARRGDLPVEEEASTSRLANSGPSGEAIAVGVSRCSSTASSTVDAAARARSGGDAEASDSRDVESSVSDSECGGRERRETTPSSRPSVDYTSDLESSQATDDQRRNKRCRRTPATTTASTAAFMLQLQSRARMPAAAEIDEFFAAAERAQAEHFTAKYNFDVALGVPLNAGRFEWTPVATI